MSPPIKKLTVKQKREALQAQLPTTVSILGRECKILITNLKGLDGDYDASKNLIRIHQNSPIESARSTLFHEAVHVALSVSGHREMLTEAQEEAIVRMMENAFFGIVDIDKLSPPAGVDKP